MLAVFSAVTAGAQAKSDGGKTTPPVLQSGETTLKADTILTHGQETTLLGDEDEILHFVSKDTLLPIKAPVKCRFISRDAVAKELRQKFDEDKGAKRMERSELVLKKFGLLDQDFKMRPFLLSLLTEQIAGFYDNKTKQMNLLDWVPIDQQKPVMAHELTHALQDQRVGLEKWDNQEIEGVAKNVTEDNRHIANDDTDTAREAVLEGQAMVSFADHMLADNGHPGKTLKNFPQLAQELESNAGDMSDSPVLARAPLVLQQALLFPYTSGLAFEQAVLMKNGTASAFAGVLDSPPSTTYEILTPNAYLRNVTVPVMKLPDIHPMLKEAGYEPYDIGVMGELDVRMTAELFGGRPLAEAWSTTRTNPRARLHSSTCRISSSATPRRRHACSVYTLSTIPSGPLVSAVPVSFGRGSITRTCTPAPAIGASVVSPAVAIHPAYSPAGIARASGAGSVATFCSARTG